jgi:hypothetical protein
MSSDVADMLESSYGAQLGSVVSFGDAYALVGVFGSGYPLLEQLTLGSSNSSIEAKIPCKCVVPHDNVTVYSAGFIDGHTASVQLNGVQQLTSVHRGLNAVLFDQKLLVKASASFDTYNNGESSTEFVQWLDDNSEFGDLLALAVDDEASVSLSASARSAVRRLFGASMFDGLEYRSSYALISFREMGAPLAERLHSAGEGAVRISTMLSC